MPDAFGRLTDREKMWSAASAIIESLGPRFGMFKKTALSVAYDNVMNKLSDAEVNQVIQNLEVIFRK